MKRRWKVLIAILVALAALLALNTIIVDGETKEAEVTIEGGRVVGLPGGELQVLAEGPTAGRPGPPASPIVLLHCYSCSLHWWDRIAPILARRHRVIRVDLLGHGGSQKPPGGYEIGNQAALVGAALDRLRVEGAVVVGHSIGFSVATALAEQSTQLVDRLVNIDAGPNEDACSLPALARASYLPVIGQAIWRLTPDFLVDDGYKRAFAPGYEIADGFPNPDQVVDDLRAMTFTSFRDSERENSDFVEELPLDQRLRQVPVPLLSIFGSEDQICDPEASQAAYETVPGARLAEVKGAGHSPNVEEPRETAALIEEFAAEAGDDTIPPLPRDVGQKPGNRKRKAAKSKPG
jgi:pimeloyl-ACP methyl ester carboxylesterase